jgi:hypothetical protein
MKKLIVLIGIIAMVGCVSSQKVPEGKLIKTKIYVGKYESSNQVDDKFTFVMTTNGMFKLKHNPVIPDSSLCYVRLQPPSFNCHPDIREQMTAKYISWSGSEKEYMIYNEVKTIQ